MIKQSDLEKYDLKKMYLIYDEWPKIAQNAFHTKKQPLNLGKMKHIVFAGMGGSGALGDFFSAILSKTNIHVTVVKGYSLPKTVDSKTLVIVTSVSGNTSESLIILKSCKKNKNKIIAFSSGGKIEKYCKKNHITYEKIEEDNSPRASFVRYLYSILRILQKIIPINQLEIEKSIKQLEKTQKNISTENLSEKNTALQLAIGIKKIPIIYYPWGLQGAAIRFKNSLQENAKIHAIAEDILETSHNGIVAWEGPSNVRPVLIQGKNDHLKTKQRWKIIKEYFNQNDIEFIEISSVNGNIITKLINLIYIFDFASIYLAIINKKDPTPVKSIEYIKKKLE
jgi:glucose/mannose-6-phosphate isomerase